MKTISAVELKKKLDNNEVMLVDVREPAEFRTENIEGAVLIPLAQLSVDKLSSSSRPIVLLCRSGQRSGQGCQKIIEANPDLDLSTLEGGMESWKAAGFKVRKMGGHVLPLDQQMRLTAGSLVLIGLILGTYVNPYFYWLTGFIGLGLVCSGLSGWCGMVSFLSLMPWNK